MLIFPSIAAALAGLRIAQPYLLQIMKSRADRTLQKIKNQGGDQITAKINAHGETEITITVALENFDQLMEKVEQLQGPTIIRPA